MWLLKLIAIHLVLKLDKQVDGELTYEVGEKWRHETLEPMLIALADWMAGCKWLKRIKSARGVLRVFSGVIKSNAIKKAEQAREEHRRNEGC
jgi:hypothetical protein